MNQHDDDKALDRYLEGDSTASRQYAELGDELPPPELDARILAEAERAVKVTPLDARRAPPFKAFAWAAIVVLSFSLVLNIVFEQAAQDPGRQLESMAGRSDMPAAEAPPIPQRASEEDAMRAMAKAEAPAEPEPSAVAGLVERRANAVAERELATADERKDQSTVATARKRSATEPGEGAASDAISAFSMDDEVRPLAQTVKVLRPAESPVVMVITEYLVETEPAGRREEMSGALIDTQADADPDARLQKILDLYEQGRDEDASQQLETFRAENPDHPVSVELRERGL